MVLLGVVVVAAQQVLVTLLGHCAEVVVSKWPLHCENSAESAKTWREDMRKIDVVDNAAVRIRKAKERLMRHAQRVKVDILAIPCEFLRCNAKTDTARSTHGSFIKFV